MPDRLPHDVGVSTVVILVPQCLQIRYRTITPSCLRVVWILQSTQLHARQRRPRAPPATESPASAFAVSAAICASVLRGRLIFIVCQPLLPSGTASFADEIARLCLRYRAGIVPLPSRCIQHPASDYLGVYAPSSARTSFRP